MLELGKKKDITNHYCWRERGTLHLDNSHELICELGAGLLSQAMGQVFLPHVKGGPYKGK